MSISNLVMKRPGETSIVSWIKNRVIKNENVNAFTSGPTGIGKSYVDLELAYELDPDFDPDTQIVFGFGELLRTIRTFNKEIKEDFEGVNYNGRPHVPLCNKKYKVIIFEEFQIGGNAQDWYTKLSKLLNMLLSTYRHQNFILLINAPFSDMINSQTKRLLHIEIEVKGKDEKRDLATVRPKVLQWSVKKKDFYFHSLYVIQNGHAVKTPMYMIRKPPVWLYERYEERKSAFTNALNKRIEAEFNDFEKSNLPDSMKEKNYKIDLNPLSMQPDIWEEAQCGYKDQQELKSRVEKRMGKIINISLLSRNIMSMRKKGYDIRNLKNSEN